METAVTVENQEEFKMTDEAVKEFSQKFKLEEVKEDNGTGTVEDGKDGSKTDLDEDTIKQELKIRAESFGGKEFNEDGDLLDGTGVVIKTKDELEQIEKGGTAIKTNTKAPNEDNLTPVKSLLKDFGYEEDDEITKDLDLKDDSLETVKEFYKRREESVKNTAIEDLLEADPDIKDLLQWKAEGKTADSWRMKRQAEAFNIDVKEADLAGNEKLIRQYYETNKGIKGKSLDAIVEALKDDNGLYLEAKSIADEIKETLSQQAKLKAKQEETIAKQNEEDTKNTLKAIDQTIKKGTLDNRITIPEKERKDFHQFVLSKERDEKWDKLGIEKNLLFDYLLWKDLDIKGLQAVVKIIQDRKPVKIGAADKTDISDISLNELLIKLKKRNT